MTVLEVVKTYNLGDYEKDYKDVFGSYQNLLNLEDLMNRAVKDIYINLPMRKATITIYDKQDNAE